MHGCERRSRGTLETDSVAFVIFVAFVVKSGRKSPFRGRAGARIIRPRS